MHIYVFVNILVERNKYTGRMKFNYVAVSVVINTLCRINDEVRYSYAMRTCSGHD